MMIDEWVNGYYLEDDTVENIRQSVLAKPGPQYAVLDNFFQTDKLDKLIEQHSKLEFNEAIDRTSQGQLLPYDGAVVFADKSHVGAELFFDEDWHRYLAHIVNCNLSFPTGTEVKLRWHTPNATGFWVHTDSTIRQLVAICYFNRDWKYADGGLLQLWRVEADAQGTPIINSPNPKARLDVLNKYRRIRTFTPGGGFPDKKAHDLVLLDQVVPAYNRLFVCNYQCDPAYHSVTPSNGRTRTGFVQWLGCAH